MRNYAAIVEGMSAAAEPASTAKYAVLPPRGTRIGAEGVPDPSVWKDYDTWEKFQINDSILANSKNPYYGLHQAMDEVQQIKAEINAIDPGDEGIMYAAWRYNDAVKRAYTARNKLPLSLRDHTANTSDSGLRARVMRGLKPWLVQGVTALMSVAETSQPIYSLDSKSYVGKLLSAIPDIEEDIIIACGIPHPPEFIKRKMTVPPPEPFAFLDRNKFLESNYSIAREIMDSKNNNGHPSIIEKFSDPTVLATGLEAPSTNPVRARPEKLFHIDLLLLLVAISKLKSNDSKFGPEDVKRKINQLYETALSFKSVMGTVSRALRLSTAAFIELYRDRALELANFLDYDYLNANDIPYDILFENEAAHVALELGQAHVFLHHGAYIGNNVVIDVWNRMFDEYDALNAKKIYGAAKVSTTFSESTVSARPFDDFLEAALNASSPVYLIPYIKPYNTRLIRRRALWTIGRFPHYNIERESCESHAEWTFDNSQKAPRFCMFRSISDTSPVADHPGLKTFLEIIFKDRIDVSKDLLENPFYMGHLGGGTRNRTRHNRRSNRKKTHRRRH